MYTAICNGRIILKFGHCILLVMLTLLIYSQNISPVWIIDNHQFEFEEEIALIDVFTPSPNRTCGNITLSLADADGNLLLYTDGLFLYDNQHNTTPNGRDLNSRSAGANSIVVIPDYLNLDEHYIFYLTLFGALTYSVVDMSLNNGLGDIRPGQKNITITPNIIYSYIEIFIDNCDNAWILAKEQNSRNIHFIRLNNDQTIQSSVVSSSLLTTEDLTFFGGGLIVSQENRTMIVDNGRGNKVLLAIDDDLNITSELLLQPLTDVSLTFRGAFSPTGTYYYGTEQYVVREPVQTTKTVVVRHGPFLDNESPQDSDPQILDEIQTGLPNDLSIGPDDNIYFLNSIFSDTSIVERFLGVISNIDSDQPCFEPFLMPLDRSELNACASEPGVYISGNIYSLRRPNIETTIIDSSDCMIHTIQTSLSDGDDHMSSYSWSTGDTTATIVVEQPGEFTVEVDSEGCILRDTIEVTIDEGCELPVDVPADTSITTPVDTSVNIPMSNCNIYIPNAISLGSTRGNNSFVPVSNCAFDEYTLQVFDRYGGRIFSSVDPNLSWDGSGSEQSILNGIYTYTVRYRFLGSSDLIYDSGTLTVIN